MSEVITSVAPGTGSATGTRRDLEPAVRGVGPTAWIATMIGFVLAPPRRDERGITTIEWIFGVLLAVAIITTFVSVLRSDVAIGVFEAVIKWALLFRKVLNLPG